MRAAVCNTGRIPKAGRIKHRAELRSHRPGKQCVQLPLLGRCVHGAAVAAAAGAGVVAAAAARRSRRDVLDGSVGQARKAAGAGAGAAGSCATAAFCGTGAWCFCCGGAGRPLRPASGAVEPAVAAYQHESASISLATAPVVAAPAERRTRPVERRAPADCGGAAAFTAQHADRLRERDNAQQRASRHQLQHLRSGAAPQPRVRLKVLGKLAMHQVIQVGPEVRVCERGVRRSLHALTAPRQVALQQHATWAECAAAGRRVRQHAPPRRGHPRE
eukprot:365910-Chlamydomonas_euryale.AAC.3